MRRLGREDAFAELDMAERTELLVGDVRYEVWRCQACGAIEKRGTARDVQGLAAAAVAPPVGSAAFLRRRAQSGLSIWTPGPTSAPPSASSIPAQLSGHLARPAIASSAAGADPARLRASSAVEPPPDAPHDGA